MDVEVRPLPVSGGGVSTEGLPNELVVEALSRMFRRRGGCNGEDVLEVRERCESLRNMLLLGSAKDKDPLPSSALGEGIGKSEPLAVGGLASVCRRLSAVEGGFCASGDCWDVVDNAALGARGVVGLCGGRFSLVG